METIFSNLESLYQFQVSFLQQLEVRIDPSHMEESQIGEVFVSCVSLIVISDTLVQYTTDHAVEES